MVRKRWALPPLLLLLPCLAVLIFLSPARTVQPGSRRTASAALPCAGRLCGGSVTPHEACFGASGVGLTHSLIVVVRDRSDALLRVLPSWLRVEGLEELVLVDWGSHPTVASVLRQHGVADARLRQAAAPLESEWNLARAYNLAAQLAHGEVLLKVDSDTWLHEGFLRQHALPPRTFFAGDWTRAPDENAWHLNGVVLLRREDYAAVAGYDERIRHYGHGQACGNRRLGRRHSSPPLPPGLGLARLALGGAPYSGGAAVPAQSPVGGRGKGHQPRPLGCGSGGSPHYC